MQYVVLMTKDATIYKNWKENLMHKSEQEPQLKTSKNKY